jgi:hypothetical protein
MNIRRCAIRRGGLIPSFSLAEAVANYRSRQCRGRRFDMSFIDESLAFDASGEEREGRARREEKATDSLDFGDGIPMTCAEMAAELNAMARGDVGPKRTSVLRRLNRPATFRMIPPLTSGSRKRSSSMGAASTRRCSTPCPRWTSSSGTSASCSVCTGR